ncbi:unnamed protein product [Plutella xylostella]|uniref:(diamondback moth) hypothetical protein n=1 Tax=Plutella xylostella TaxID=51655 RepID=A0A8S4GBY2_PLUXY|nr:unnamed protein product [Plutella xylostella]
MKCSGCQTESKDLNYYTCSNSSCKDVYCSTCSKTPTMSTSRQKLWVCPSCCAKTKKGGDNTNTPIRGSNESSNLNVAPRNKPIAPPSQKNEENSGNELKELTGEVRRLTQLISSLKDKLDEATQSLSKCHVRLEELASSMVAADDRIRKLEIRDLELSELKSSVVLLNQQLNSQAQNHLKNEIEISGLPENTNENLNHTVLLISKKIGVELQDREIDWVTRVGPRRLPLSGENKSNFPRPVVVRLLRRSLRDQMIKAAKSRKNLNSSDFDIQGATLKVFLNERLTKENRLLFREARILSKEKNYAYCWINQGNIYVRQKEGKPAKHILCHEDLERVFGDINSKSANP